MNNVKFSKKYQFSNKLKKNLNFEEFYLFFLMFDFFFNHLNFLLKFKTFKLLMGKVTNLRTKLLFETIRKKIIFVDSL